MRIFLVLLSVALLSACSIKEPGHRPTYTSQELTMMKECRAWVQKIEDNSNAQMNAVPTNQKAFVIMHRDTMGMMESIWGKNRDICQPEDSYAVAYQAYVRGQTEISVTALKEAGASARAIAYVAGTVEVAKNFGGNDSSSTSTSTTTITETTTGVLP